MGSGWLDTDYTVAVKRVKQVVGQLMSRGGVVLVVDETGVGVPVVEDMRRAAMGCPFYAVKIPAGKQATAKSVPREELLTKMRMMGERGELEIAAGIYHGEYSRRELAYLHLESAKKGGEKE